MEKYLVTTTEVYRVSTEEDAQALIEEAKNSKIFVLKKYSAVKKEKKVKGEIEDEWICVTLVKTFNEEKEPAYTVDVIYEV